MERCSKKYKKRTKKGNVGLDDVTQWLLSTLQYERKKRR